MLKMRSANIQDIKTYFNWANDDQVRKLSFNSEKIPYTEHEIWFNNSLANQDCFMYLFYTNTEIGQVRIQKFSTNAAIINISLDKNFRGMGYGDKMLNMSIDFFRKKFPKVIINAYIKTENIASKNIFEKSGFKFKEELIYKKINSYHYINV